MRSEEHTSELQSHSDLVCRLLHDAHTTATHPLSLHDALPISILQRQFPEIEDFYLPPEACSYRLAVVSMKKQYPGHAKRVMFGIWSALRQFMYTKFIIATDDEIGRAHV